MPDLIRNAPQKPTRLSRDVASWARRVNRAAAKNKAVKASHAAWAKVSKAVKARHGGRCRICRCRTTVAGSGANPNHFGSAHHIVYRSAGGADDLQNLIWLCAECHQKEHAHELDIRGTADKLKITIHLKADRRLACKERGRPRDQDLQV